MKIEVVVVAEDATEDVEETIDALVVEVADAMTNQEETDVLSGSGNRSDRRSSRRSDDNRNDRRYDDSKGDRRSESSRSGSDRPRRSRRRD